MQFSTSFWVLVLNFLIFIFYFDILNFHFFVIVSVVWIDLSSFSHFWRINCLMLRFGSGSPGSTAASSCWAGSSSTCCCFWSYRFYFWWSRDGLLNSQRWLFSAGAYYHKGTFNTIRIICSLQSRCSLLLTYFSFRINRSKRQNGSRIWHS